MYIGTFVMSAPLSSSQCSAPNGSTSSHQPNIVTGGKLLAGGVFSPGNISDIADFPENELSFGLWVRTTDTSTAGTLVSFQAEDPDDELPSGSVFEFLFYDPRNLKVIVRQSLPTAMEIRNPHMRNVEGEFISGVSVNDGEWHFIILSWGNIDGIASIYIDGKLGASSQHAPVRKGAQCESC